jgi:hypothetical protein
VLSPPLADAAATRQELPSKFFITSKTQSAITRTHTSAAMTFSASDFTMVLKSMTHDGNR